MKKLKHLKTNMYETTCFICKNIVPARTGVIYKINGHDRKAFNWSADHAIRHRDCKHQQQYEKYWQERRQKQEKK